MISDGYHDLPPGKLAAMVTHLVHDLTCLPALAEELWLDRLREADCERYRCLFRAVGQEWLWASRLRISISALRDILADPAVHAFALIVDGHDCGLMELDLRQRDAPELAFFGLVPSEIGRGWGRALMSHALMRAKMLGAHRLLVHTCTFDHPKALDFYCQNGFLPFKRALEVFEDPRLDGTLPREAAAAMPVIERV